MRTAMLIGSLTLGMGLAACDRGGKAGEVCQTPTQESGDCAEGLSCVRCGEVATCEQVERWHDRGTVSVPGKVCDTIKDVRSVSEIKRGLGD